jgi:hypothetical protein
MRMANKRTVRVGDDVEFDIDVVLPGGRVVVLQYRNYEGDPSTGNGASLDVCLDRNCPVINWIGTDMTSAPQEPGMAHIRLADQLCICL